MVERDLFVKLCSLALFQSSTNRGQLWIWDGENLAHFCLIRYLSVTSLYRVCLFLVYFIHLFTLQVTREEQRNKVVWGRELSGHPAMAPEGTSRSLTLDSFQECMQVTQLYQVIQVGESKTTGHDTSHTVLLLPLATNTGMPWAY